jgi:hypothetical protein
MEEYNPREAFEKYKKEKEETGVPIDPRAVTAGKREMELGEKGDFAVYADEPTRDKKIKSYPQGELLKTDMTKEELQKAVADLTLARQTITAFMEYPTVEGFDNLHKQTLFDLEKSGPELPEDVSESVSILAKYDFDGDINLWELPEEIKKVIDKDTLILQNLEK